MLKRMQLLISLWIMILVSCSSTAKPMDMQNANPRIQEAYGYLNEGVHLNAAYELLISEKEKDPYNPIIYTQLARHAMQINRNSGDRGFSSARIMIESAIELNPKRADTYVLYGFVLLKLHHVPGAEAALKKATRLGTTNTWLDVHMARLFGVKRQKEKAYALFERVANTKPYEDLYAVSAAAFELSRHYAREGRHHDVGRIHELRLSMEHEDKALLYHNHAIYLMNNNQIDAALINFEKALAIRTFSRAQTYYAITLCLKAGLLYKDDADNKMVRALIEKARTVSGSLQGTFFHIGTFYANTAALSALSRYGDVDVNGINTSFGAPLLHAMVLDNRYSLDDLDKFLNLGVDLNIKSSNGTALHKLINYDDNNPVKNRENLDKIELLLKYGARTDIQDRQGKTVREIIKNWTRNFGAPIPLQGHVEGDYAPRSRKDFYLYIEYLIDQNSADSTI